MPGKWISANLRAVTLTFLLCSVGSAVDVSWIGGSACPMNWSVQPASPSESDVIRFSGPTGFHLNRSLADREFGGRPAIRYHAGEQTVELYFEPPARQAESGFWDPVCGVEGTFGPLEPGSWRFVCHHEKVTFSIAFEVTPTAAAETVLYVDANATGANTGLTWADALVDLQAAIAQATPGTEIRVAAGKYVPHDVGDYGEGNIIDDPNPRATFTLKSGVTLRGGYAGSNSLHPNERDLVAFESILSGDLYGNDESFGHPSQILHAGGRSDNAYHVVMAVGTDATAVLDGFTVTGGHAWGPESQDKLTRGGGIYVRLASPTIRNCLITGNAAFRQGGGVYTYDRGTPSFVDCVIADNWSDWWGGGLLNSGSDVHIERSLISGNWARYRGGGVYSGSSGSTTLVNCILSGNAVAESDWGRGGALYNAVSELRLIHCTLAGNRAPGGASLGLDPYGHKGDVRVRNSILWDADEPIWNPAAPGPPIEIEYSNVRGGWDGEGNFQADPCVVDVGAWQATEHAYDRWLEGNYRLRWDSPCLDAGDPRAPAEPGARDFFGRARLSGAAVDVGACELTNDPPVADAGPNVAGFSLDGVSGLVTLDAGRSYDPEGRPLTSRWYREGELLCEQQECTVELPVGEHVLTLIVDDGVNISEPDEIVASVMQVTDVPVMVAPELIKRDNPDGFIVMMALAPRNRRASDLDPDEPMLLFPGGIESVASTATRSLTGRTLIVAKFPKADLLQSEPNDGPVELRLVGRFEDGQYFSGAGGAQVQSPAADN